MKKRTAEEKKLLNKKIIKYYFENSNTNSYKHIMEKFNVNAMYLNKVLSKELEKRFKNSISYRMRNY
tara:strand:+ start:80 stop:280 length:201 start_codon:yes stop_codon:yes gene_type:complete